MNMEVKTGAMSADEAVRSAMKVPGGSSGAPRELRATIASSIDKDPVKEVERRKLSQRTGIPISTLKNGSFLSRIERQDKLDRFNFDGYSTAFPRAASFLSDPDNAAVGHDDAENLGAIEATLDFVADAGKSIGSGLFWEGVGHRAWGALGWSAASVSEYITGPIDEGLYQIGGTRGGFDFFDDLSNFALKQSRASETQNQRVMQETAGDRGFVGRNFMSGMNSLGATAPGVITSVVTKDPRYALGSAGVQSFGGSAERGLAEGLSPLAAGIFGAKDAAIEVGTEMIPINKFIGDLTANSGLIKTLGNQLASEVPGELLATTLQNLNEWATLNPDEPFSTYLEALPQALADTLVATISAVGVQTGSIQLSTRAMQKVNNKMVQAQNAEDAAGLLEELTNLSNASQILERDPDTFEKFIEMANDNEDVSNVYVDTNTLAQSGLDLATLAELSPSIAKQKDIALNTGGLIKIPVSEYATTLAKSEFAQPLLEDLKIDPNGMSRREAQEFMQNSAQELEQEVERELEDTFEETQRTTSRQVVEENILGQLRSTNRFTESVNKPYATLVSNFYETIGARSGRTAQEAFDAFPLTVQSEGDATEVFSQDAYDAELNSILKELGDVEYTPEEQAAADAFLEENERRGDEAARYEQERKRQLEKKAQRVKAFRDRYLNRAENAAWTEERLTRAIAEYEHTNRRETKGQIGFVDPVDFLLATAPIDIAENIADEAGVLDRKRLVAETQTPNLIIEDGAVLSHEGRHRMIAMARAGVRRAPVTISDWGRGYDVSTDKISKMELKPQADAESSITIENVFPALSSFKQEILDMFEENTPSVLFQETQDPTQSSAFKEWFGDSKVLNQQVQKPEKNNLGLFSSMERELLNTNIQGWKPSKKNPEGKASGKEILQKVKSLPLKKEEVEWLGIEEFLNSGDKFTREDVINFIRNNGVQIEETIADNVTEAEGDVTFNEGDVWDDPEAWEWKVKDIMSEWEDGFRQSIDDQILNVYRRDDMDMLLEEIGDQDKIDDDVFLLDWLKENKENDVRGLAESNAEMEAEEEYRENPVMIYQSHIDVGLEEPLFIFGNDDQGYDIRQGNYDHHSNVVAGGDIYSYSEAEIQANEYARENGLISDESDESVAKWEEYTADGPKDNYREVKLKLPDIDGDFYEEAHFPDRNVVAFIRVNDRNLENAEEVQKGLDTLTDELPDNFRVSSYGRSVAEVKNDIERMQKEADANKPIAVDGLRQVSELKDKEFDQMVGTLNPGQLYETLERLAGDNAEAMEAARVFYNNSQRVLRAQEAIERAEGEWNSSDNIAKKIYLEQNPVLEKSDNYQSKVTYEVIPDEDKFRLVAKDDTGKIRATSPVYETAEEALSNRPDGFEDKTVEVKGTVTKTYNPTRNTYFVDEFQSDWHQQGRQQGYSTGKIDARELDTQASDLRTEAGKVITEGLEAANNSKLIEALSEKGSTVVDYSTTGLANPDGFEVSIKNAASQLGRYQKMISNKETLREEEFELYKQALDIPEVSRGLGLYQEALDKFKEADAERNGVPDAPFKGDNWIALGMKRALVQAAEEGYESFAWVDAQVLSDRWSERYAELYRVQYDTKMPSIIKKLTKQKPKHVSSEENPEGFGYWQVDLTPELREQILSDGFSLFQGNRGSFNPETSVITLLEAADLSTFLHESGHFFLETMNTLAQEDGADQQIIDDMDTLLKWFGVKDMTDWNNRSLDEQRDGHEKFARGFEAYLFEGKAPNVELQGVFSRFRSWLVNIYRDLANLNVELNDEIRSVFDRMLATDEAIKETEETRGMQPMFTAQGENDMFQDPEEWAAYQALGKEATADAKQELDARSLRDMKWLRNARSKELRRLQKDAAAKRRKMKDEVTNEIMLEPVNQAHLFITRGEYTVPPNANKKQRRLSTEIAAGEGSTKMDLAILEEAYGSEDTIWQDLPKGKYGWVSKNGLDFNFIAELFGFSSGDQMLQMLIQREDPKTRIEALTDQRMLETYGDITDPASLEAAADAAVHNDARTKMVAAEANALQKAVGGKKLLSKAAKDFAVQMVSRLRIRDVKPSRYTAAEARASKEARKAHLNGDLETAAVQKRNQLIQMHAAKAALEVRERVEKDLRYLKKFDKEGPRKKIDVDYLDQIDGILERFDLKKSTSLRDIDNRKNLTEWLAEQEDVGIEPDIPEEIINSAYRKSYKEMTVEEMQGLVESVKQIEHLGRLKNKLLTLKDKREFGQVVDEVTESIRANYKGKEKDNTTRATKGFRAKALFRGFLAEHRKIASLSRQMDGAEDGGAMWEVFIRTMNEAGDTEAVMREQATVKMAQMSKDILKLGKMGGKGTYFPTLGRSLNREERLAIVLNMGNESNMQRLLDGKGWTRDQVEAVVQSLTATEAKFVQDVWDLFESYRPQIAAKEKRIYGKEPNWIEPAPLQTPHGELRGGYYPVKYDTRQNAQAEQFEAAEVVKQQLKGAYTSSTTRRSFTKDRADKVVDRPLLITMDALYGGLNEVIHDLSWHEWLIDANRLVRSKKLSKAVLETQGADAFKQYKLAIEDIAAGEMAWTGSFEKVSAHLRAGATVAGLGLSISTALINVTGLGQSFVRVGTRFALEGVGRWATNPTTFISEIYGKSEFMRLRGKTMQREINEIQSLLQDKSKVRQTIDTLAFAPIVMTQVAIDAPTWWGGYKKALSEGNTEERAIALADQAVIDSQGGGQVKDLASIQRTKVGKLFTVFYSYFSTTYQLTIEQTSKTNFKDPLDVMRLAGDYFLLYIMPAALGTIIRGAVSGDDDWAEPEVLAQNYINEQISFAFGTVVGMREIAGGVQKAVGTNQYFGGYSGPASMRFLAEMDKLGAQIGQGELDKALLRSTVNVAGVALRLPSSQTNRTIDGMIALMDGDTANPAALAFGAPN